MLDELQKDLIEDLKDPDFAKAYGSECAKSEIGLALFHARQSKHMTQKELADLLGVKQPYIAELESGEVNLTFENAGKMLAILGLKIAINLEPLAPGKLNPVSKCDLKL
jgi:transcriptional regulator with XRE-family HTH domain